MQTVANNVTPVEGKMRSPENSPYPQGAQWYFAPAFFSLFPILGPNFIKMAA